MAFSRRDFLKRLGIGAGAAVVGVALPKTEPEEIEAPTELVRHNVTSSNGTVTSGYIQIQPYIADENSGTTTVSSTDFGEHWVVYYPDGKPYSLKEMREAMQRSHWKEINA